MVSLVDILEKTIVKLNDFRRIFLSTYENIINYREVLRFLYLWGNEIKVKFKSKIEINVKRNEKFIFLNLLHLFYHGLVLKENGYGFKLDWQNKIIITPDNIRLSLYSIDKDIFPETYIYDIHFVDFDLKDKIVVDIGGYIGDTALYYANKGAIVYAYEPHPIHYKFLLLNLELNPELKKRIKAFNKAVGIDGVLKFPMPSSINRRFSLYYGNKLNRKSSLVQIPSVSLSTILKENKINEPYLLKVDCEGCEMDLIKDDSISLFKKIKIEYHVFDIKYNLDYIIETLKNKGFKKIRIFKYGGGHHYIDKHGMMFAER